jgi:hypothetical protein
MWIPASGRASTRPLCKPVCDSLLVHHAAHQRPVTPPCFILDLIDLRTLFVYQIQTASPDAGRRAAHSGAHRADAVPDRIRALNIGPYELGARLRVLVRRSHGRPADGFRRSTSCWNPSAGPSPQKQARQRPDQYRSRRRLCTDARGLQAHPSWLKRDQTVRLPSFWSRTASRGLSEADRPRLGERFFRVPGITETASGPGWSIVQRIVCLHAAKVNVRRSKALSGLEVEVRWQAGTA